MNNTLKRHLISATITFLSTFITVFGANLLATDELIFTQAVIVGAVFTAARTALKVVVESFRNTEEVPA